MRKAKAYILNLENKFCSVKILVDTTYDVQSSDNRYYDLEWNPENYGRSDFYKVFSIHIDLFDNEINIALIGNYHCYDIDCAVLDGKVLTIMQYHTISQICVDDGTLMLHKAFECFGCTFGLYRVVNGYIVYGEIEIIMLDLDFNKVWEFTGRDIFVSQTRENAFVLGENSIELYDWEDNYYELDFNGNLICGNSENRTRFIKLPE